VSYNPVYPPFFRPSSWDVLHSDPKSPLRLGFFSVPVNSPPKRPSPSASARLLTNFFSSLFLGRQEVSLFSPFLRLKEERTQIDRPPSSPIPLIFFPGSKGSWCVRGLLQLYALSLIRHNVESQPPSLSIHGPPSPSSEHFSLTWEELRDHVWRFFRPPPRTLFPALPFDNLLSPGTMYLLIVF